LNGCRRRPARSSPGGFTGGRSNQRRRDRRFDAVRRLRPERRDVIVLRFYLDMSEAEIAARSRSRPAP
jgi:DNA-directed RNA polymerase specialized sigma24 family protein